MRVTQERWTPKDGWQRRAGEESLRSPQLVLVFGSGDDFVATNSFARWRERFPTGTIVSCSTAGEISQEQVTDGAEVATALEFERTTLRVAARDIASADESAAVGEALGAALCDANLRHVLLISEGLEVNGSGLTAGLRERLPGHVSVSGGLAGDGTRMQSTAVGCDDAPRRGRVVAVGLYGDAVRIGFGTLGGWDPFGPERIVTRSQGNVLYELDGASALSVYRKYLGEYAHQLPSSGLLFPLAVRASLDEEPVVRTLLALDETEQSITFAGDVPNGARARLMRANFDRLIDGAADAARHATRLAENRDPTLALLVSCVGRKLLLGQRVEEEVEGVREVLGPSPVLAGFYSYGEVCSQLVTQHCALHNQSMTVTTIREESA
ncbi:MAG: FIST C-terminal domain-containing protein [Planctomycetes bacterium]|nr:FIST C-terminal domain-containing protein [Planctomycetota bacterium]